ncbi:MAG: hypothetical protein ACP5UZ_08240 [Thermoplasmata archaeon]
MISRENLVLIASSLISAGTPFMVVPILLSFLFRYPRSVKILLFLFFISFNVLVGNFVYISFILLFVYSITKTTRTNFVLFTILSIFALLLPFSLITWQLALFAIGIVVMIFAFVQDLIGGFFSRAEKKSKSITERKKELYRRLAGWK